MKLVITQHRPLRRLLISLGGALGVALVVALALDYGHWRAIAGGMVATGNKRSLLNEVAALRRENDTLRYTLARLERTEAIDRAARRENHALIAGLEADVAALEQDVQFYRDVVGSAAVGAGPRVGGIRLRVLDGRGRYGYKLVMTYIHRDGRPTRGELTLRLRGELGGERRSLDYAEVMESGPESLAFEFKHFYLFEGTLKIPAAFVPRQIEVAVRGHGARNVQAETYDWASVLN